MQAACGEGRGAETELETRSQCERSKSGDTRDNRRGHRPWLCCTGVLEAQADLVGSLPECILHVVV